MRIEQEPSPQEAMDFEDAFQVLDRLVLAKTQTRLKDVEKFVLHGAWQNQTYDAIADSSEYRYTPSYLKQDVGPKLWKRLSEVLAEPVSKTNFRSALERLVRSQQEQEEGEDQVEPTLHRSIPAPSPPAQTDWGEAIDVSLFYGRNQELSVLKQWILQEDCRLVALLGMGGIGKTSLSVKLAEQVQHQFEWVIWRSLRNAQPIADLLADLILFVANDSEVSLADSVEGRISQLLTYLRQCKCLIVLDNVESILHSTGLAGQYRVGYESFGQLLNLVGETAHQSCVVITSREKPQEVADLEGETLPVRSLQIGGLTQAEAQEILQDKGLLGTVSQQQELIDRYAGNPLALKIVATSIQEIFDGNIAEFLEQGTAVFNGIRKLLDRQLSRLSNIERSIMDWLAIHREPITLSELQSYLVPSISKPKLLEALESLARRSLIDRSLGKFTQQPVVMEYMTEALIEQIVQELTQPVEISTPLTQHPTRCFNAYALIQAQAKDHVRETQTRLILMPIVEQLLQTFSTAQALEKSLLDRVAFLQEKLPLDPGYAVGNTINMLRSLNLDLSGRDFSKLTIRQAYLPNVPLENVNFAHANLVDSVFTEVLTGLSIVQFHPAGTRFATADTDGNIHLWDAATGQQILVCKGHTRRVWSIAFSPDGQFLASCSEDCTVRIWQVESGQCLNCFKDHTGSVISVAFDATGQILASGSFDQTVKLWNVFTGQCLNTLTGHESRVWSVGFSPDGETLVSSSGDGIVKFWNPHSGECWRSRQVEQDAIYAVPFSSTGDLLATGGAEMVIRLWNRSGECLQTLTGHTSWVVSLIFSPDGQTLISSGGDGVVKVWDVVTGRCTKSFKAHSARTTIALSPDGKTIASASLDQIIKLWDLPTGQCLKTLQGYTNLVLSLAFDRDGSRFVSGNSDGAVRLWNATTGECLQVLKGHQNWVLSTAFSPDGQRVASGSSDFTAKIWDAAIGVCLKTLQGHTNRAWSVAFSPQGHWVATGSPDKTVKLWDVSTGDCLLTLQEHEAGVMAIAFSPDGQTLVSASEDKTLKLWQINGKCLKTFVGHSSWVWTVAFSPDGRTIASGSEDQTIKLWDVATGDCFKTLAGHTGWVWSIAYSPDGSTVASAADDLTLKIWDVSTGNCLQTLQGHTKRIWTVAYSPDGMTLISGGLDATIKLWNLKTGECVKSLNSSTLYGGMNIAGIAGVTEVQKQTLKALGAIDR